VINNKNLLNLYSTFHRRCCSMQLLSL